MSYDTAITIFSPDGHLFQVEYAAEAVKKGKCLVGVRGGDCIVFAVERKGTASALEDTRTKRKLVAVDQHILMSFAGLQADGRVLSDHAKLECQSYRYNYDDTPSIEYLTRHMAREQQRFTQRGGVRPYGISTLIAGFSKAGQPRLFMTEPSGSNAEWQAASIGRNSKQVMEFLEANYSEGLDETATMHLAVKGLLEVVEAGSKNMEIGIARQAGIDILSDEAIQKIIADVEAAEAN